MNRVARPAPLLLLLLVGCSDPSRVERRWQTLGRDTVVQVEATTEMGAVEIVEEIRAATGRIEAVLDPDRADGELARLNRQPEGEPFRVQNRDLLRLLTLAFDWAAASEGAFDPTVGPLSARYREAWQARTLPSPLEVEWILERIGWGKVLLSAPGSAVVFHRPEMRLDLGEMLYGFVLDVAARKFSRMGSRAGTLHLGNSIYVWGHPAGQEALAVELPDPRRPGQPLARIVVHNRGLAVCAATEPLAGSAETTAPIIVDPRDGRLAASDVRVAAVLADSSADAGALATALVVTGSVRGGALLSRARRVEALLVVDRDGQLEVLASGSLRDRLSLADAPAAEVGGRVRYLLPPQSI